MKSQILWLVLASLGKTPEEKILPSIKELPEPISITKPHKPKIFYIGTPP